MEMVRNDNYKIAVVLFCFVLFEKDSFCEVLAALELTVWSICRLASNLEIPPVAASRELGLKACATNPSFFFSHVVNFLLNYTIFRQHDVNCYNMQW